MAAQKHSCPLASLTRFLLATLGLHLHSWSLSCSHLIFLFDFRKCCNFHCIYDDYLSFPSFFLVVSSRFLTSSPILNRLELSRPTTLTGFPRMYSVRFQQQKQMLNSTISPIHPNLRNVLKTMDFEYNQTACASLYYVFVPTSPRPPCVTPFCATVPGSLSCIDNKLYETPSHYTLTSNQR